MIAFSLDHSPPPMPLTEPVPAWTALFRQAVVLRIVSQRVTAPKSRAAYGDRVHALLRRAAAAATLWDTAVCVWRMEKLSAAFARYATEEPWLRDVALPPEARPIAYMGLGIGAVERAGFDPKRVAGLIEALPEARYRPFAYESVGAMLALYEADWFYRTVRAASTLGLATVTPLTFPDPRSFLSAFSSCHRRLMAHGYGRVLYFKRRTLRAAMDAAGDGPVEYSSCVQGIAFAYAMVNCSDLPRIARVVDQMHQTAAAPVRAGLIDALEFCEWFAPGLLQSHGVRNLPVSLIREAGRSIAANRANGYLRPFIRLELDGV